jgi:hypothetical protein
MESDLDPHEKYGAIVLTAIILIILAVIAMNFASIEGML